MNWINTLMQGSNEPVERTIHWDGREQLGYFKKISAAERQQLVAGQKISTKGGQAEVEVDLGANEQTKQRMVYFATVNPDGSRAFESVKDVGKIPGSLLNALFKHASDVNKDESEEDLGKD